MKHYLLFAAKVIGVVAALALIAVLVVWQGNVMRTQYGTATKLTGKVAQLNAFHEDLLRLTEKSLPGKSSLKADDVLNVPKRSPHLFGYNQSSWFKQNQADVCPAGEGTPQAGAFIITDKKPLVAADKLVSALRQAGYTVDLKSSGKATDKIGARQLAVSKPGLRAVVMMGALPDNERGNRWTVLVYSGFYQADDDTSTICLPLSQLPAPR